MVTSPDFRHVPTGTLAILAQRLRRVFASPTTWRRLVRERGWRRPRLRAHPSKPKVGIRAERPNEIWHIDTTIIRHVDGTKAYVHAIIDNFSRRIPSSRVAGIFNPANTIAVLLDASRASTTGAEQPTGVADGGVENVNWNVDELIHSGLLRRVLAMTELKFSNSMIEAWWRTLKHNWLFLNTLDSVETVRKHVAFYVAEHNERLPQSAFRGQTPDEMYFGNGDGVQAELDAAKKAARQNRLSSNRASSCGRCDPTEKSAAAWRFEGTGRDPRTWLPPGRCPRDVHGQRPVSAFERPAPTTAAYARILSGRGDRAAVDAVSVVENSSPKVQNVVAGSSASVPLRARRHKC
ncbi:MAG: DDE-type integrase/transposase/recombinase [Dehalococcoidia bacterium]|nr:DDE-type integrase/transposase/recombinase [Dehalococcoidia bacterium]